MNTEKNILTTDIKEITNIKTVKATIFVIIGSIFYALAVTWIFKLGNFFAGGATGTSQIFVRYVSQIFDVNLPLGLIIFLVLYLLAKAILFFRNSQNLFAFSSVWWIDDSSREPSSYS